ncbi:MAG: hypothetical protein JXN59_02430 [Anaerolineae bacterium]|nr:hypothetical protein [Anaerolineae bacterium]
MHSVAFYETVYEEQVRRIEQCQRECAALQALNPGRLTLADRLRGWLAVVKPADSTRAHRPRRRAHMAS